MVTPLLAAVSRNSYEDTCLVLGEAPTAVWDRDPSGNTPLHLAAQRGDLRLLSLLHATQPAVVHVRNCIGDSALHVAARYGNVAAIDLLVGAERGLLAISQNQHGQVPLALAASVYTELARQLWRLSISDCAAEDAILAALEQQRDGVAILLQATPVQATSLAPKVLHTACCLNHHVMAGLLVQRDPSALLHTNDHFGNLPIHTATTCGASEVVRLMLRQDPGLASVTNASGETPLHCAASGLNSREIVADLLRAGPHLATELDDDGNSALGIAAMRGCEDTVELLLGFAPHMANVADADGCLPIWLAAWFGNHEAAEVLVRAAPDTAAAHGGRGHNALHVATDQAWPQVVEVLVRHQPQLASTVTADTRESAMHLALAPEHFDTDALAGCCAPPEHDETTAAILAHLLRAAPELAQVPLESADGGLALHQVAMFGMPLCVQQLLAVCPEAAAVSSRTGSVPLALALEGGHYDAARALVQATGQAARVFEVLCNHQHCGRPMPRLKTLFGPAIKAHLPLPDECWPNVPKRLPGLLALLPDVLKRGNPADARQLVARLTPAADTLLMSMLGALGSSVALPAELVQRIIALACAY